MLIGALFVSINVATTEEIILISYKIGWHALVLILVSLVLMQAFVYAVEFKGSAAPDAG